MRKLEMNKTCSRCTKVVYPLEELKCLDKIWHKTCFKCHECGMTLNMKSYKGFNKLPYCEAHIPKAKATAIADTPELKRIAENTKIQSNVKYHAEFEKQKGKVTQVADDPETLRIKQNTKIISNVAYHGDLEKKAAMEKQRGTGELIEATDNEYEHFSETLAAERITQYKPNQQQFVASHIHQKYHESNMSQQLFEQPTTVLFSSQTPAAQIIPQSSSKNYSSIIQQEQQQTYPPQSQMIPCLPPAQHPKIQEQQTRQAVSKTYQEQHQQHAYQQPNADYMQIRSSIVQNAHHPSGGQLAEFGSNIYNQYDNYARPTNNTHVQHVSYNNDNNSNVHNTQLNYSYPTKTSVIQSSNQTIGADNGSILGGKTSIGKIADYDPLTDGPRNIPSTPLKSATLIYTSDHGTMNSNNPRQVGGVTTDIDSANGVYGQMFESSNQNLNYRKQNQSHQGNKLQANHLQKNNMRAYRALYDYEAQDSDEVSFTEGDLIFEIESIDAGWMTGKVERTGKTGMLPANYVQPTTI